MNFRRSIPFLFLFLASIAFSQDNSRMFDIRGWGAYQFGQIEKGTSVQGDLNKVWMQQAILQTTVDGKVGGNGL